MDSTLKVAGGDWKLQISADGQVVSNFELAREKGQHFHVTMVEDTFTKPDGTEGRFRQPLTFEHDQGHDKVGDVVIQLRHNPETHRYMVQVDQENVFETETLVKKIYRAVRSSVDNVKQAVQREVAHTGWLYANARRIGGKPIKTHYVIAGWSPQMAGQMMDVYNYVQTFDSMGLATFVKALQSMPDKPARAIFNQMRTPPDGNGE